MLDNELDDIIRRASGQHKPVSAEGDWEKMHALLDKHMPQKSRDRARFILLPLLLLSALGITGVLIYNNNPENKVSAKTQEAITTNSPVVKGENNNTAAKPEEEIINSRNYTYTVSSSTNLLDNEYTNYYKPVSLSRGGAASIHIIPGLATEDEMARPENNDPAAESFLNSIGLDAEPKPQLQKTDEEAKKLITAITENADNPMSQTVSKKKKNNPLKNVGFNFSIGPDISFVNISKPLSSGIVVGGGASYSFGKRFSVQTGIYLSNKIYMADSSNYHPPSSFWGTYNNLQKVNGTALVFEFPLSATANIIQKGNKNIFITAGASSYIVKKETYTYSYKNTLGQPDKRNFSIKEKEKHKFSVLHLSAGIETKPNNRVSYKAEPFIKIPMSGIGFGKMDLKSMGIMFGIQLKPFAKKD